MRLAHRLANAYRLRSPSGIAVAVSAGYAKPFSLTLRRRPREPKPSARCMRVCELTAWPIVFGSASFC